MMISDEELKHAAECDIESEIIQFCALSRMTVTQAKTMHIAAIKTQDIARELLQLRAENRALKDDAERKEYNQNIVTAFWASQEGLDEIAKMREMKND
jgi:hypothetical protein